MTFTMTVDLDNAAFVDDPGELPRLLRAVASSIEQGSEEGNLRDINGNTCGAFEIKEA